MMPLLLRHKRFIRVYLPAILWALIIFAGSSIPAKDFPNLAILAYDKVFHFLLFGLFCYFLHRALQNQNKFSKLAGKAPWVAFFATVVYGIFDELHQVFVPGRSPDPFDLLADSLGALAATLILLFLAGLGSRKV
jgi:hypothetical protein